MALAYIVVQDNVQDVDDQRRGCVVIMSSAAQPRNFSFVGVMT
jgi:hypothetical protein